MLKNTINIIGYPVSRPVYSGIRIFGTWINRAETRAIEIATQLTGYSAFLVPEMPGKVPGTRL